MALVGKEKLNLSPEGGWQVLDFTLTNPTSSPVSFDLFDANTPVTIPSTPYLNPPSAVTQNIAVGVTPEFSAYCTRNDTLYVVNFNTTISVIGSDNVVYATISAGLNLPVAIAYHPLTNTMYVVDQFFNTIRIISCVTNTVISSIVVPPVMLGGGTIEYIVYNSILNKMYVSVLAGSKAVIIINCSVNAVYGSLVFPFDVYTLAFNPYNNFIYASESTFGSGVYPLDCATNLIGGLIPTVGGSGGLACQPTSNLIYVTNYLANTVSIIDCFTNTVVGAPIATLGNYPVDIVWDSINDYMYVTNLNSDNVTVIDCKTNTAINLIPLPAGANPVGITWLPLRNTMYVCNQLINNVSVISPILMPYMTVSSYDYFQFVRDLAVNPKTVRQIALIAPNAQLAEPINFVYTNMGGQNFTQQLYPNLSVTKWMPQSTIAELDFSAKNSKVVLDEHTYMANYVVQPYTTLTMVLYYKELIRANLLDLNMETPLLTCKNLELDNCREDAVEKSESEMENFGETVLKMEDFLKK